MKTKTKYLSMLFLAIFIASCGEDEPDVTPPTEPTNITVSLDYPEAVVQWESSTDNGGDITYEVYLRNCGVTDNAGILWSIDCWPYLSNLTEEHLIAVTTNNQIFIEGLEMLKGYSVAIKAIDGSGNTSEYSTSNIFKTIYSTTSTGDIILLDQLHVDFFNGHEIEILDGDFIINTKHVRGIFDLQQDEPTINDFTYLNGISEIKGNLKIAFYNPEFDISDIDLPYGGDSYPYINFSFCNQDLSFFNGIRKIGGNLEIYYGCSNILDLFSNLEEVGGQIIIKQTRLTNYCGISGLITENNFEISENSYNPIFGDFQTGNCSSD